jgi:hypothetical protein
MLYHNLAILQAVHEVILGLGCEVRLVSAGYFYGAGEDEVYWDRYVRSGFSSGTGMEIWLRG